MKDKFQSISNKVFSNSNYYNNFIIAIIVIVLLNVVGINLFKYLRLDLTKHNSFSLSDVSKDVVGNLADPLRVRVFFSKKLPAPHNDTERYLRDLLTEYSIAANKYFKYTFYDCTKSKEEDSERIKDNIKMAQDYGISPVQIRKFEKDQVNFINAYMGVVIQHGDIIEKISPLESTSGLEYKITGIIRKMNNKISAFKNLSGKVQVKLYLSSSLQAVGPYMRINGLGAVPERIKAIVKECNDRSYGKLQFEHLDNALNKKLSDEIETYGIRQLSWRDINDPRMGKNVPAGQGSAAIVIEWAGKFQVIEMINVMNIPLFGPQYSLIDLGNLDETINTAVDSLLAINDKIAYVSDHGTISLDSAPNNPYMQQQGGQDGDGSHFSTLLSKDYSVEQVASADIEPGIPALIIAGPKEQFSEYELFKIDQYLMSGGSLIIFYDGLNETMPPQQNMMFGRQPPTYSPNKTGLERLLAHYGVTVENSYAFDKSCYEQVGQNSKQPIYFAPLLQSDFINHDLAILRNINGMITLKVSPLTVDEEKIKENKLELVDVIHTSDQGWKQEGRIVLSPAYITPPDDDSMESFPLAYILEGEFSSYFKGIPEKTADEEKKQEDNKFASRIDGKDQFTRKGKFSRIFVMGSAEVLKNNLVDESGSSPNGVFLLNIIDYMNGKSDWGVMRAKTQQYNPLNPYNPKANIVVRLFTKRLHIKIFNIGGLILLVIATGLFVSIYRKNQKRAVYQQFYK